LSLADELIPPENTSYNLRGSWCYMAFPRAYLSSAKNLPAILAAIQTSKAPQFDKKFLESLELKSPSDQKIIDVLKGLKFISDQGAPTERYYAFLDQTQAPGILANAIRDAYADLFQANINAHNLPKSELIDKFRTARRGQLSASVTKRMIMTFAELCKLADFQTPPFNKERRKDDDRAPDGKIREAETNRWKKVRVDGGVYRVLIVSPESSERHRARRRARRRASGLTLAAFLTTILVATAFVSIFGTPR
jgi:hypothetical protein